MIINTLFNKGQQPLYNLIASVLRNKILSGQLEPQEKLPTENELVQQFGASKITIRNALSMLEAEGLIIRNRGRGTFVSETIPIVKQFTLLGSLPEVVLHAEKYKVKLYGIKEMEVKETRIPRNITEFFGLSKNSRITRIQRLRLLDGVPIYFLENYLSTDIAQQLTSKELSRRTLLSILKEKVGLAIDRGEMYIEAVPADIDVSELLQCQPFDPLILRKVHFWFESGDPFEVVLTFMRPEYFRIKINVDTKGL